MFCDILYLYPLRQYCIDPPFATLRDASLMEYVAISLAKQPWFCEVWWVVLVYSNLQAITPNLKWIEVWTLTRLFQDMLLFPFKPFQCRFSTLIRVIVLLSCSKKNLCPSPICLTDWNRFSSRIDLDLVPSIFASSLTTFPILPNKKENKQKHPYSMMPAPPCFTLGMVMESVGFAPY